ncbi:MAG: hypothetical protein QXP42_00075 [Candidatus Micrarchaeia archaeon]
MEDEILPLVKAKLKEWEGETINLEKLKLLRELIGKKTGKHKYSSFKIIRKWVKEAKKALKKEAKEQPKTPTDKAAISAEPTEPKSVGTIIELPKPKIPDKVYLQTISFEIAGIRRGIEKMNKQLQALEEKLKELKAG